MRGGQRFWLAAAGRGFVLLTMGAPVLWSRDAEALAALAAIGAVWLVAQAAATRPLVPASVSMLEAALVGVICGVAMAESPAVLGALALQPFTAGLWRGVRGVALAVATELLAVVGTGVAVQQGPLGSEETFGVFTWVVTGLGLGLIASFLHAVLERNPGPLEPYLYAQSLIRQLIDLSGGLSSGLDPQALGGGVLSTVRDELPTAALAMYIPRGEGVTPLVTKTLDAHMDLAACEAVAAEACREGRIVVRDQVFAFPLRTETGTPAVVAGLLSERLDPSRLGLDERIRRLQPRLEAGAVHLDTALLFLAFRDAATADERRRLAREMHDGIAQDIASLGYLVDVLAAGPADPATAERIELLRDRITAVVTEVRQAVVNLRTSVGTSESLGAAISAVARNLRDVSGVPIQVTLDEHTMRLRPEVEAELFRIAQEAMHNAVKHARASAIDVHCRVHPPEALITVADDGRGLGVARHDSQGLKIMQERAHLVNAELSIEELATGGVLVSVRISAARPDPEAPLEAPVSGRMTA